MQKVKGNGVFECVLRDVFYARAMSQAGVLALTSGECRVQRAGERISYTRFAEYPVRCADSVMSDFLNGFSPFLRVEINT